MVHGYRASNWKRTFVFFLNEATYMSNKTTPYRGLFDYFEGSRLWSATTGAWKQTLNVNTTIRSLLFSMDGRYLKTDQGLLSLNSGSPDTYLYQEKPICAIFANCEWVTQDGQNLLSDYRTRCSALLNNMLVLGHASGQVTFIEFASSWHVLF
jgi:hypothetical protein